METPTVSVMASKNKLKEKAEKCNQKIQVILNKYGCKITATPVFKVEADGSLKVKTEVKIVPLVRVIKPKGSKFKYPN